MVLGLAKSVLASPSLAAGLGALGGKGGQGTSDQATTGPIRQTHAGGDIVFGGGSDGGWIWLVVLALFVFAFVKRS